jgi:hypothetical protein
LGKRSNFKQHFDTSSKKGRGMAQRSLDLIEAMAAIVKDAQPITGRGVGYKLFTQKLIDSPGRSSSSTDQRLPETTIRCRGPVPAQNQPMTMASDGP